MSVNQQGRWYVWYRLLMESEGVQLCVDQGFLAALSTSYEARRIAVDWTNTRATGRVTSTALPNGDSYWYAPKGDGFELSVGCGWRETAEEVPV